MANGPDLILADEPTGNLPTDKGEQILQLLEDLNKKGVTIVMVTHEEYIANQAQRTVVLRDGQIERDERNGVTNRYGDRS